MKLRRRRRRRRRNKGRNISASLGRGIVVRIKENKFQCYDLMEKNRIPIRQ
jgi:hypothetical protein